ncbi:hypothetical protein [Flavobacterium sp. PL02]|uniref:hypothetical protein n=1 Tax=Flavobacterium sp. PL02 TaxID=3088354 RepID=UPI002B2377C0|nr:hypothetical protein [Flavobacterium sp. PL02]MEA9414096.1 hypothetical protein [Flavobacterium sp. PL02]
MKTPYQISDFIEQADENGYVALKVFCNKVFRLNDDAISGFFDSEYRFYDSPRSQAARKDIRNNISFIEIIKKRRATGETYTVRKVNGGIYKDDLEYFIAQAKIAILENDQLFDKVYEQYALQRNEKVRINLEKYGSRKEE